MMAVTTDRCCRPQIKSRHRGHDIEAGLTLQAQRLQGERVVEPSDKTIGTAANAYGRTGRGTDITAGQRARPNT